MKYLLVLVVVVLGLWALSRARHQRKGDVGAASAVADPVPMSECLHCGVHLPQAEACRGERGLYCSVRHCEQAGDRLRG